ncbi:TPA: thiopeptide-type bacteriocin biosynthesis protein [Streptococcus pyogenes]|nr:thiopeptide-type bacteriocin biosynthesis protein [Streptococcus pyogenes]
MIYKCDDKYLLRTPNKSIDDYLEKEELIHNNTNNDFLCEKILSEIKLELLISNSGLVNVEKLAQLNRKSKLQVYKSIYKYYLRNSLRPTPFGAFSSISIGRFLDDHNSKNIVIDNNKKLSFSADLNWLNKVINDIERDRLCIENSELMYNYNVFSNGIKLKNLYLSNGSIVDTDFKEELIESVTIRNTNLIKLIKENTKVPIKYKYLIEIIKDKYKNASIDQIRCVIDSLLKNEILYTNYRLSCISRDRLKMLVDTLKFNNVNHIMKYKKIESIYNLIAHLNNNDEITCHSISKIYKDMGSIKRNEHYLNTISTRKIVSGGLPYKVKKDIEKFVDTLTIIPIESECISNLSNLKNFFVEKYGINNEVKFVEIINSNKFNGIHHYLNITNKTFVSNQEEKILNIFDSKIQDSILKKENVYITKEDFSKLFNGKLHNNTYFFQNSFDINFFVTRLENQYSIVLGPNVGSDRAGNMLQRFVKSLEKQEEDNLEYLYRTYDENDDDTLIIEIFEKSGVGRLLNISDTHKRTKNNMSLGFLPTGDKSEIYLHDLALKIDDNMNFIIVNGKTGKKCKFVTNSMLNPSSYCKISRLLLDLSKDGEFNVLRRLTRYTKNQYKYLPRIYVENVIISLKKWNLDCSEIYNESFSIFEDNIKRSIDEYEIDKIVYLNELDNRLLLNLDNHFSLLILHHYCKINEIISLSEIEPGLLESNLVLDNFGKKYVAEFVLQFKKQDISKHNDNNVILSKKYVESIKHPFEDGWIYFKLLNCENMEEEILDSINGFDNSKLKFFYVRYTDERGKHLRVRIKFKNSETAVNNIIMLTNALNEMETQGLFNGYELCIYEREVNRYGGIDLIKIIEKFFIEDSKYIIENILCNSSIYEDESVLCEVMVSEILKITLLLFKDNLEIYQGIDSLIEDKKMYSKEYRNNKNRYEIIFRSIKNDLRKIREWNKSERDNYLEEIRGYIDSKQLDYSEKKEIILSIIHMFCNKIKLDRQLEIKAYSIVRKIIKTEVHRKIIN